jgi:hypothetical protein
MPDVFINYRTGDEESAATLVERDLAARFGEEKVFRASRSVEAGEAFPQRILGAVHGSRALLAVIGSRWADTRGRQLLADKDDWVRRELLEARKYHVRIIPVLVGDLTLRLDRLDLPAELSWLRHLQYRRLNSRDADANLDRIAADLTSFVPGLVERRKPEDRPGNMTNISGNYGPVHGGIGDQFIGWTTHIAGRGDQR